MMYKYLSFSIAITLISWIAGMTINSFLRKTAFYNSHLSNLNFLPGERTNRLMGMNIFKWIVKNTFFKFFNQKLKLKSRIEKEDLIKLRAEMTISETDHLTAFIFVTVFAVVKFISFGYLFALIIMLVNVLMNLYPSLLQQENKRRIDRLMIKL